MGLTSRHWDQVTLILVSVEKNKFLVNETRKVVGYSSERGIFSLEGLIYLNADLSVSQILKVILKLSASTLFIRHTLVNTARSTIIGNLDEGQEGVYNKHHR